MDVSIIEYNFIFDRFISYILFIYNACFFIKPFQRLLFFLFNQVVGMVYPFFQQL